MNKLFTAFLVTATLLSISAPSFATETPLPKNTEAPADTKEAAAPVENCTTKEDSTLSLSLNSMGENPEQIIAETNATVKKLTDIANTGGATKFLTDSSSYNFSPSGSGMGQKNSYNYNATYNFRIEPTSIVTKIVKNAAEKGIYVSFYINSYRQCE